jgi:hypothetical protein
MHARDCMLVFVLGSVGCHNCGNDSPKEESDTDPFAGSDGCGFICTSDGSSSGGFTTAPVDDTSAESSSGGTTGAIGPQDECAMSSDCGDASFCVAPFDQSLGPEGKGAYACVVECVPLVDEDLWCADATACCDPNAVCTDRGYCELPESTGTDGSGGSDTGGSSGSGDSGTGDDSGSGSTSG